MKTFKEFLLTERGRRPSEYMKHPKTGDRLATIEESELLLDYAGIQTYLSPHSLSREVEREVPRETLIELCRLTCDYIKSHMGQVLATFEQLFYSTKLSQGFVTSYRRDHPDIKKRYLFIVTVLPPTKNKAKSDTGRFVLESNLTEEMLIEKLREQYSIKDVIILD